MTKENLSKPNASKKTILSWCLYDWANSAFSTVILTFIFSVYFAKGIASDEITGTSQWAYAIGFSGLCVAILGPILGIKLDFKGGHIAWLRSLTIFTALCVAALYFMRPEAHFVMPTLFLVILSVIGFELSQVVYNALLPSVALNKKIGRISGWAWALGYVGGLFCLGLALILFVGLGDTGGLLGVSSENSLNIRATCLLVAVWFVLFSLPLIMNKELQRLKPHNKEVFTGSLLTGVVMSFFADLKELKNIIRFLIASALYRDGLVTLFAVGGLYAAGTFGLTFTEILIFGIGLNVTAGLGAFLFSYMDDMKGSKNTITFSLWALILCGIVLVLIEDKTTFMATALALGLFVGPVQAASRTFLARITPREKMAEIYGLYALSGKSIAFLGPLTFGLLTDLFQSQRAGVASIIGFWLIGLFILRKVSEQTAHE